MVGLTSTHTLLNLLVLLLNLHCPKLSSYHLFCYLNKVWNWKNNYNRNRKIWEQLSLSPDSSLTNNLDNYLNKTCIYTENTIMENHQKHNVKNIMEKQSKCVLRISRRNHQKHVLRTTWRNCQSMWLRISWRNHQSMYKNTFF